MPELSATVVWPVSAELVLALDARLGPPVDSYVNGSQTWLSADGPGEIMVEWRLHPVGGYVTPDGLTHYDIWDAVVGALAAGADADALPLGPEPQPLHSLWTVLECFAAYGDDVEPGPLAAAVGTALGIAPAHFGTIDHEAITEQWLRSQRADDLGALVVAALQA